MRPIIRMSSAGKCPRALSAELLNYESSERPAWLDLAAEEGKLHENAVIDMLLEKENIRTMNRQMEARIECENFTLLGHIEGEICNQNSSHTDLLEVKSMSQYEFDRWMRNGFLGFPAYAAQVTCYMSTTGHDKCLYIVKNRNSGYIDRKFLAQTPVSMSDILIRLDEVAQSVLGNRLIETDFNSDSIECRRCNYKHLCIPEPVALTFVQEAELDKAAIDWRIGTDMVKHGEAMINEAKDIFERHSRTTKANKWRHNDLAINLTHVNSGYYKKEKLLKLFTEEQLEPAFEPKSYDQLRITDLRKED